MKKLFVKYKEIIMYLIFGVATTVVSWVSYALFTKLISTVTFVGITVENTTTANVLSWICAVLFAFITNKIWVFDSKSWRPSVALKELGLFVVSRLISGVIEIAGVPLLIWFGIDQTIFGIEGMVAKVLISVIVVILNYVFSKLFIFKSKKKTIDENTPTDEIIEDILEDIRND